MIASHGGHIEYLNGLRMEWWGFKLMLDFFGYFEKKHLLGAAQDSPA